MTNDFLMFIRKIPVRLTHLPPQKCVQEWIQTRTTGNSTALMSSMTATLRRKSFLRIILNILVWQRVSVVQREKSLGAESKEMGYRPYIQP